MAGRPANRVEIGMLEFLRLGFFTLACHENEADIGDLNHLQNTPTMLKDIEAHSKILLTLEQLDSLIYHYKMSCMYYFNAAKSLKTAPSEYQSLMKNIQRYIPQHVSRNKFGELIITGFNHKDEASQKTKLRFRHKIQEVDPEVIIKSSKRKDLVDPIRDILYPVDENGEEV